MWYHRGILELRGRRAQQQGTQALWVHLTNYIHEQVIMQAFYLNDSKSNLLKEHRKTKATQPSKLPGQRTKRTALIFKNKI